MLLLKLDKSYLNVLTGVCVVVSVCHSISTLEHDGMIFWSTLQLYLGVDLRVCLLALDSFWLLYEILY